MGESEKVQKVNDVRALPGITSSLEDCQNPDCLETGCFPSRTPDFLIFKDNFFKFFPCLFTFFKEKFQFDEFQ